MNRAGSPGDVVRAGQCIGCGFCTVPTGPGAPAAAARIAFDPAADRFLPIVPEPGPAGSPEFVCPAREMDMPALAMRVHGREPDDAVLGTYRSLRIACATDEGYRSAAASGGVIPALLAHLFATRQIDCAYCMDPGDGPLAARGRIVRDGAELATLHGSVYHPADFGAGLRELVDGEARFAFVGLPCEVAALEMLKARRPELARRHVLSIGLFCGGINAFGGMAYYLEGFGVDWRNVANISYRNGPWPGRIRLALKSSGETREIPRIRGNTRWKILRYIIGFQGYWMFARCRLCPDQVADFADLAVGDPHLPRFRQRGGAGFSVLVTRTARGERIFRDAIAAGTLKEELVTRAEVIESQGYTLDNRRNALAYVRVARWLGMQPPDLRVYHSLQGAASLRHYVYAWVDLAKIRLSRLRWLKPLYFPWQIFEYLFLTFAPNLILRRIAKLLRNK